jgi:glycogen debranching enzyme
MTLISLQGTEKNIESGEMPGKFVHEFRRQDQGMERLVKNQPDPERPWENPWYVYADNTLRNYDSIDSSPLALIAIYKYWQLNKNTDKEFLISVLPAVEAGLNWIITYGDLDKDFLLEYELPKDRKHGGLSVQSWTDSRQSLLRNGKLPKYPIAPVEVQGYAWLALTLWGQFYLDHSPSFGQKLLSQASELKKAFNKVFIIKDNGKYYAAQALDGDKNIIKTVTGNPLLLLWATNQTLFGKECILDSKYIPDFVERGFRHDLYEPKAGIRTMSSESETFNPNHDSYHNGSFWPVLNGMIYEGLLNWGYKKRANELRMASLKPLEFFNTPIELYTVSPDGKYQEYFEKRGQRGCRVQAWSAATMLDMLTDSNLTKKILFNLIRVDQISQLSLKATSAILTPLKILQPE